MTVRPPPGERSDVERRVVGGGDRADDREPEAVVAVGLGGAAPGEPLERLEQPLDLAGRDHRPGVR